MPRIHFPRQWENTMQKYLITTVSALALAFSAANVATAQDRSAPSAKDPAATSPSSPTSPGAGAIKREGDMKDTPAMQERRTTEPRADSTSSGDSVSYKSYSESKKDKATVTIVGDLNADKLLGADVTNASGDDIGEVQDLAIGSDNKVSKAIIEVGGFLGIGSKFVLVDINELKPSGDEDHFVTSFTKDQLKMAPEYEKEGDAWVRSSRAGMKNGATQGRTTPKQ